MTTIVKLKQALTLVDRLGQLQDQIEALKAQEALLKDELKNQGEGVQVGQHYTSEVKLYQKTTVDHKAVYAELNVAPALLAKYSKSTAIISITVKAIKGE